MQKKIQESLTDCSTRSDGVPTENENENDTNGDVHPKPPPQDNDDEEHLKEQQPSTMLVNSNTSTKSHHSKNEESGDMTMESDNKSNKSDASLIRRRRRRRSTTIGIMLALVGLSLLGLALVIVLVVYAPQNANSSNDAAVVFTTFDDESSSSPSSAFTASVPPTRTQAPSDQPSLSAAPSTSRVPTLQPSSLRPSAAPSAAPSISRSPSPAPTGTPSTPPTRAPSESPTPQPTKSPSQAPSVSLSPTFTPIDPNYDFKLRLYWERGYFWQDVYTESWWCMECTVCDEYGTGDGWESGCQDRGDGSADNCRSGDLFWVKRCLSGGNTKFNVVQTRNGDQIRLDGTNLCLDRQNRYIRARYCDSSDPDQLWAPISDLSKFELRPLDEAELSERDARCASQHHHPKSDEIVSMHDCRLNRIYETLYWEEF